jgi:hypothetical protein
MLTCAENVVLIVAVGVSIHDLAGLDWPWAIVVGAAVSIALRWLIHGGTLARLSVLVAAGALRGAGSRRPLRDLRRPGEPHEAEQAAASTQTSREDRVLRLFDRVRGEVDGVACVGLSPLRAKLRGLGVLRFLRLIDPSSNGLESNPPPGTMR